MELVRAGGLVSGGWEEQLLASCGLEPVPEG
jgi:hypothetical protein